MGKDLKAFHGDPVIKEKYLSRLKAHYEADEIIQGIGWENGKGCAVGCTLDKYAHDAYPDELGLPMWLALLQDWIFEGLSREKAKKFPLDFIEAIPVGADVSKVIWKLAIERHSRDVERLKRNKQPYAKECVLAINSVIELCGEMCMVQTWSGADQAEAAWAVATLATLAQSAEAETAAEAAWAVATLATLAQSARAETAAEAAEAAWSATLSAVAQSAALSAQSTESRNNHFEWEAETLLKLLSEAPTEKRIRYEQ